jgi:hypothetical protein
MITTILIITISSLLIGLCVSQREAMDRELRFRIKYHNLFYGSKS